MAAQRATSVLSLVKSHSHHKTTLTQSNFKVFHSRPLPNWSLTTINNQTRSKSFKVSTISSSPIISTEPSIETETKEEKFDWYSQWYPLMPICDLDNRVPHGLKVLGLDIVVWWDKNENTWKVFDDACPHRLAPLSDGRIDKSGRLQCAYHGWCFNGSGNCKLIPQAPSDGPQVHTFKKACAKVYPSTVHHDMVWFWPNTDPKYKNIIAHKKPPSIPQMDDPSFIKYWVNRDIPYGYEVLTENIMDPAHVPYAHFGIMQLDQQSTVKVDREGGRPFDVVVDQFDVNGFSGKHFWDYNFIAPCTYYNSNNVRVTFNKGPSHRNKEENRTVIYFFCIPVSPGNCRMIWGACKENMSWIDKLVPRWILHIKANLIIDSDLYLLHKEEYKFMEAGAGYWQKACFVPTKSDGLVVAFRKWLNKYSDGQINWGSEFNQTLPPSPPREQLMDRYWTHVVNCSSCNSAYKSLNIFQVVLQVIPIVSIGLGITVATKYKTIMVLIALVSFGASKLLSHFIYKNFHFHDYNHSIQ